MNKYKLGDLKVDVVFKNDNEIRTIIAISKTMAIYAFGGLENCVSIDSLLSGKYGELIVPAIKTETYEIDGKKYTEEQLNSMEVIKCKTLNLVYLELTTLPAWVAKCIVLKDFHCRTNNLTSLQGSPKSVGGSFYCTDNKLTNLKGAPKSVGRGFYCYFNNLTSLEGAPENVGGQFFCIENTKKFTEEEVRAVSKVKGRIRV